MIPLSENNKPSTSAIEEMRLTKPQNFSGQEHILPRLTPIQNCKAEFVKDQDDANKQDKVNINLYCSDTQDQAYKTNQRSNDYNSLNSTHAFNQNEHQQQMIAQYQLTPPLSNENSNYSPRSDNNFNSLFASGIIQQNQKQQSQIVQNLKQGIFSVKDSSYNILEQFVEPIYIDFVYLTEVVLQKTMKSANKQLQDTLMNYFLENHVSNLIIKEMNCVSKRAVRQEIEKTMVKNKTAKYMNLLNAFENKVRQFVKEKSYENLLIQLISDENSSSKNSEQWKTLVRKRILALLLYVHWQTLDGDLVFNDFFSIWDLIYPNNALPQKVKKYAYLQSPQMCVSNLKQEPIEKPVKQNKVRKINKQKIIENTSISQSSLCSQQFSSPDYQSSSSAQFFHPNSLQSKNKLEMISGQRIQSNFNQMPSNEFEGELKLDQGIFIQQTNPNIVYFDQQIQENNQSGFQKQFISKIGQKEISAVKNQLRDNSYQQKAHQIHAQSFQSPDQQNQNFQNNRLYPQSEYSSSFNNNYNQMQSNIQNCSQFEQNQFVNNLQNHKTQQQEVKNGKDKQSWNETSHNINEASHNRNDKKQFKNSNQNNNNFLDLTQQQLQEQYKQNNQQIADNYNQSQNNINQQNLKAHPSYYHQNIPYQSSSGNYLNCQGINPSNQQFQQQEQPIQRQKQNQQPKQTINREQYNYLRPSVKEEEQENTPTCYQKEFIDQLNDTEFQNNVFLNNQAEQQNKVENNAFYENNHFLDVQQQAKQEGSPQIQNNHEQNLFFQMDSIVLNDQDQQQNANKRQAQINSKNFDHSVDSNRQLYSYLNNKQQCNQSEDDTFYQQKKQQIPYNQITANSNIYPQQSPCYVKDDDSLNLLRTQQKGLIHQTVNSLSDNQQSRNFMEISKNQIQLYLTKDQESQYQILNDYSNNNQAVQRFKQIQNVKSFNQTNNSNKNSHYCETVQDGYYVIHPKKEEIDHQQKLFQKNNEQNEGEDNNIYNFDNNLQNSEKLTPYQNINTLSSPSQLHKQIKNTDKDTRSNQQQVIPKTNEQQSFAKTGLTKLNQQIIQNISESDNKKKNLESNLILEKYGRMNVLTFVDSQISQDAKDIDLSEITHSSQEAKQFYNFTNNHQEQDKVTLNNTTEENEQSQSESNMLTHLNEKADYVNLSIPIIDNNKLSYEYSNSPEQLNNIPNFNIGKARIIKNIKNNTFIDNSEKFIRQSQRYNTGASQMSIESEKLSFRRIDSRNMTGYSNLSIESEKDVRTPSYINRSKFFLQHQNSLEFPPVIGMRQSARQGTAISNISEGQGSELFGHCQTNLTQSHFIKRSNFKQFSGISQISIEGDLNYICMMQTSNPSQNFGNISRSQLRKKNNLSVDSLASYNVKYDKEIQNLSFDLENLSIHNQVDNEIPQDQINENQNTLDETKNNSIFQFAYSHNNDILS